MPYLCFIANRKQSEVLLILEIRSKCLKKKKQKKRPFFFQPAFFPEKLRFWSNTRSGTRTAISSYRLPLI